MTLAVETNGTSTLVSASYSYDAFGNRVAETVVQGTTTTTTDSSFLAVNPPVVGADATNWRLYADLNSGGTVQTRYMGGTQPDQWFARIDTTGVHWLLTDNLGSVRAVTNSSGAVIDSINYDVYGNITSESSPATGGRIKYAGYQWDSATGLYETGRWYMASAGRWLTQDPSGLGPDSNPYRYVGNDPTNNTDPTGLLLDPAFHWRVQTNKATVRTQQVDNAGLGIQGTISADGNGTIFRTNLISGVTQRARPQLVIAYNGDKSNAVTWLQFTNAFVIIVRSWPAPFMQLESFSVPVRGQADESSSLSTTKPTVYLDSSFA